MTGAADQRTLNVDHGDSRDEGQGQRRRRRQFFGTGETSRVSPDTAEFQYPEPLDQRRLFRRRRYASAQLSRLSAQYMKVRGDLLVSVDDRDLSVSPDDRDSSKKSANRRYAIRCADYLSLAKRELESRRPNFLVCSGLLFFADVTLVWLYPKGMLDLRCEAVLARLSALDPPPHWLMEGIETARRNPDDRFTRSALEEALTYLYTPEQGILIEDDLQVTRLRSPIVYISFAFLMLMLAVHMSRFNLAAT
jgi:hypothetical protein